MLQRHFLAAQLGLVGSFGEWKHHLRQALSSRQVEKLDIIRGEGDSGSFMAKATDPPRLDK